MTPTLEVVKFYDAEYHHQNYYKGSKIVLTRFGPVKQSTAYKKYGKSCGRDSQVQELWADDAPFLSH